MTQEKLQQLLPSGEHNRLLETNVRPPQWRNPTPKIPYQLAVIGAGTAGLVTAAAAAGLGARVALIERSLMGGDCLNVGCVPSKALIGAARVAACVRDAADFGIHVPAGVRVDFGQTMERMRRLRARISPNDSAARFNEMGVDVFFGDASFLGTQTIAVRDHNDSIVELSFKKAVIATGARASAPPVPGLDRVKYLTNETVFSLTELPKKFGVLGAGPIGVEMAQSFARFGSQVFLFEQSDRILSREDRDASDILQKQFKVDGINMVIGSPNHEISPAANGRIRVSGQQSGKPFDVEVDQLLVAVGRAPNTEGLRLEAANVRFGRAGVEVNDFLQTSSHNIYAAGDICSKYKFTHAADFQARIVVQNALFALGPFGRRKFSRLIVPWTTYTSPEIAHVGMYEQQAEQAGMEIDTYTQHFDEVDRAILQGTENGFVKVHVKKGTDRILGATIVADNAGDMISEVCLAMTNGLGLASIGNTIHPYPTQAEAIRKLGDQYRRTRLTPTSKKVLSWLMKRNVGQ